MQLPNEIIQIIFNFIKKITDKRQFLKTCNIYNNLLKGLIVNLNECELEYFGIGHIPHCISGTSRMNYQKYLLKRNYCVEKFTIELCYDSYFNMIPKSYFNRRNEVIIRLLVKHGKLKLLKFAARNYLSLSSFTFLMATEYGQLKIIKWLKRKNYILNMNMDSRIFSFAALHGHLHVIKWFMKKGHKWNAETCAYAALNGHLDVLKFARENGCEWTINTSAYAAYYGHLDVLKWAVENGAEWGIWTCANAAINGQLNILKYARENGCEWDSKTWRGAIKNGNINVINWLKENNCPII